MSIDKSTWGKPYLKSIPVKKEKKPLSKVRKSQGEAKVFSEVQAEKSKNGKLY